MLLFFFRRLLSLDQ